MRLPCPVGVMPAQAGMTIKIQVAAGFPLARELGLPVIMVARPAKPIAETAASVGETVERIAGLVS